MARLEEWCTTGKIAYPEDEVSYDVPVSDRASRLVTHHPAQTAGLARRQARPLSSTTR